MKVVNKKYSNTIKVYDKLGGQYLKTTLKVVPKERADFIKRLRKGSEVLDVGCGPGRDAKEFVKRGLKVTGVDLSSVFVKIAKGKVPQGRFLKMNILDLKFPKESFDAIWAHAVLLHLERKDVLKALKGFYKVLRKGGLLCLSIKEGKGAKVLEENYRFHYKRFYTYFSKKEIETFLKKAKFKIVQSKILPPVSISEPGIKWISVLVKK